MNKPPLLLTAGSPIDLCVAIRQARISKDYERAESLTELLHFILHTARRRRIFFAAIPTP